MEVESPRAEEEDREPDGDLLIEEMPEDTLLVPVS